MTTKGETSAAPETPPVVDIGILTIRDDEFRSVLKEFDQRAGHFRGRREYALRYAQAGNGRRYTLAILKQIEQGNGEAQDAARDLLEDLSPALLLVVGIAGGLPSEDFTLGDVVLSTQIVDFTIEARKAREAATYSLSGGPIAKRIAAGVASLASREDDLGDWTSALPPRPKVNVGRAGQTYGSMKWQAEVKRSLRHHFGTDVTKRSPLYIAGPIASSDRLVKDPKVVVPWLATSRHLLAVEMESGGVYRAARERCPMLAIRGVSDIVGLVRNDAWTKFACKSAAAFTRAYLRTEPISPISEQDDEDATGGDEDGKAQSFLTNIVPLVEFPSRIYVTPTTAASYASAWGTLREDEKGYIPTAWSLYNNNVYSFVDPRETHLEAICDPAATEEHDSESWATSEDPNKRRVFVQLLNRALTDDLHTQGVYYDRKEGVYSFDAPDDGKVRQVEFQNVVNRSTITVVQNYQSTAKDGRVFPFMRHNAFKGWFRHLDDAWHLEIEPTYRFTSDGKRRYRFHEQQLRGIKQLEKNRAVLSQILLWNHVLNDSAPGDRLLKFGRAPHFRLEVPGYKAPKRKPRRRIRG